MPAVRREEGRLLVNYLGGPGVFGGGRRRSGLEAAVRSKEHRLPASEAQGVQGRNLEKAAGETVLAKITRRRKRTFREEVQFRVRVSSVIPEGILEGLGRDRK